MNHPRPFRKLVTGQLRVRKLVTTLRYHLRGEFSVLRHDIGIGGLPHGVQEEEWKFFF